MKFNHYLKRLKESEEFQKFKEKHGEAYLCAGFFVLDFETGNDIHQVDYLLPNKKVATFILDDGVRVKISAQTLKKKLPEIKNKVKTDLDALKGIVEDEMKNRTVTEKIKKIVAILHILDEKVIWNLQCILDGLGILNVHVDDSDQSVLKFEKHSLLDLVKVSPMSMMGGGARPPQEVQPQQGQAIQPQQGGGGGMGGIKVITADKLKGILEKLKKKAKEAKKQEKSKKKKEGKKKTPSDKEKKSALEAEKKAALKAEKKK